MVIKILDIYRYTLCNYCQIKRQSKILFERETMGNCTPPRKQTKKKVNNYNTHKCDLNTHLSDFYTQSAFTTLRVCFHTQNVYSTQTSVILTPTSVITTRSNVIYTRTSVISTHTRLISTRRVRIPHAECGFTRRVWFSHTRE
jgi:hypothetical protein